jgi:hypothetical protein
MIARLTEVTGREAPSGSGNALDALIGFYRAFNERDLDGLAANWVPGTRRAWTTRWAASGVVGSLSARAI